ncbi:uncharacterized protein PGTG_00853 [Puccinia graminis f. sp. tritici CRL 75-36-700-3]|uniref:Uncharacterized protein n=1 Tax=Puccinia graminis f. sp. tritici (strain CRL 75-36-700-3 / race SCCL) TaxID=418459 RepID=E3JU01_PUCGT|nr:uncharacterized protein PGTG_00853 [Puccinia graminis f. sp. tritici CRL 75-36-700-3]EFP75522.1 hypothetical protein PGTG_00853 [Puccinia graminis f. sp. tritici CRL 75-36-700-3]
MNFLASESLSESEIALLEASFSMCYGRSWVREALGAVNIDTKKKRQRIALGAVNIDTKKKRQRIELVEVLICLVRFMRYKSLIHCRTELWMPIAGGDDLCQSSDETRENAGG